MRTEPQPSRPIALATRAALVATGLLALGRAVEAAPGPSFDCRARDLASAARLICQDPALAALDRQLTQVYAQARAKATNEHPPVLKASQRGWVKGRDDCWKAPDLRACVEASYRQRISELQARYRLVPMRGPFFWACNGQQANELVVTFFATEPATLIAERGDQSVLMTQVPAASGTHYEGPDESFWEHQGEATVRWGFGAPEMRCTPAAITRP